MNGIVTLRGGFPTDIRTNVLPPIFNTFNVPDRVAGQPMVLDNWSVDGYFNPAAFTVPGTVPSVTGAADSAVRKLRPPGRARAGSKNADVSVFKNIHFIERHDAAVPRGVLQLHEYADLLPAGGSSPTLTCIGPAGSACNAIQSVFRKALERHARPDGRFSSG